MIIIDTVLGSINPKDIPFLRPIPASEIPIRYRKNPIKKIVLNEINNVRKRSSNLTFREAKISKR